MRLRHKEKIRKRQRQRQKQRKKKTETKTKTKTKKEKDRDKDKEKERVGHMQGMGSPTYFTLFLNFAKKVRFSVKSFSCALNHILVKHNKIFLAYELFFNIL